MSISRSSSISSTSTTSSTSSTSSAASFYIGTHPHRSSSPACFSSSSAACAFPSWPLGRTLYNTRPSSDASACPTSAIPAATSYLSDEDLLDCTITSISDQPAVDDGHDCLPPLYHRTPGERQAMRRNGPALLELSKLAATEKTRVVVKAKRVGVPVVRRKRSTPKFSMVVELVE